MLEGKYDPKQLDASAQELWEREGVHRFDTASSAEVFSVDTPPPTVSGSLHVGHVSSYTQAECIVRYQRMRGKSVFYPFGFDGNGLPSERLTEREHNVLGREMPRDEFVALCQRTTKKYEQEFEQLWRSLGVSADWSLCYSTIDERSMRISQRGFLDLLAKGEAYLHTSPTMWDTETQCSVAQAELKSKDQRTKMNDVRFDLKDGGDFTIATTRPELLCACVAVFIHPSHPRAGELIGKQATVPLFGHHVLIRADDTVDPEKGTGIVMCCTFGDKTDVEWYQKHKLELRQAVGRDGRFTELAGPEAGLFAKQVRRKVLERLKDSGHLEGQKDVDNVVNVYERTGREVEFLPARQWFVKVLDKKAKLLELGEALNWYPSHMGKRYHNWVDGLEWDWGISRQRFYGVPFPVWYCNGCDAVFAAPDEWLPIFDHKNFQVTKACEQCGKTDWRPETDVMDTWATSSETPQINNRWGENDDAPRSPLPMSIRPQAHDIIRTWAFYTIVKSWIHHQALPWHDVVVSGHVQTKRRAKISKSTGNAPDDPRDMVSEHGADAVRYWALSATLGADTVYSLDDIKQGRRLCVKLFNATKLAQGHLLAKDDRAAFDRKSCSATPRPIDRWIRSRLARTAELATKNLDRYEFGIAKNDLERFFWNDLCDNYLEMIKARLYDDTPEGRDDRDAALAGLYDALYGITRLLAPFVPHICEAVHQAIFRETEDVVSIGVAPWPSTEDNDADAAVYGDAAISVLTAIRRWRTSNSVGAGKPLSVATIRVPPETASRLKDVEGAIHAAGRVALLEIESLDSVQEPEVVDATLAES